MTARPGGPGRQTATFVIIGVALGVLGGVAIAHSVRLGIIVALALAAIVVLLTRAVLFAVMAMVATFATYRLGGAAGAGGVSYSDALLGVAAVLAVLGTARSSALRRLRVPLVGVGLYMASLLPTIFLNPSHRAFLELFHRLFLVGGAMAVGAWIVQAGAVRLALRALAASSAVMAVAAVVDTVATGFEPATPLGLNKNLVGAIFGLVLIVLVVSPGPIEISQWVRVLAIVVIIAGLLASQSRGGMLAAVAGLLLAFALDWRGHNRGAKILGGVAALVFLAVVAYSVDTELSQTKVDRNNNSLGVRFNVERVTRQIWQTSPVYGVGLKYFNDGFYGVQAQAPNDVIDNELAESGVVGLAGFLLLEGTVLVTGVRRRRDGPLVIAATACVAGELVHGLVDIYWSAGPPTLTFMLFGLGLAQRAGDGQAEPAGKISSSTPVSTAAHS